MRQSLARARRGRTVRCGCDSSDYIVISDNLCVQLSSHQRRYSHPHSGSVHECAPFVLWPWNLAGSFTNGIDCTRLLENCSLIWSPTTARALGSAFGTQPAMNALNAKCFMRPSILSIPTQRFPKPPEQAEILWLLAELNKLAGRRNTAVHSPLVFVADTEGSQVEGTSPYWTSSSGIAITFLSSLFLPNSFTTR